MVSTLPGAASKIAVVFVLAVSTACSPRWKRQATSSPPLKQATAALDRISRTPNAIPDAVLNAARCVVVIPSLPLGTANRVASGVATCREPSKLWGSPSLAKFTGRGSRSRADDLLVLVLNYKGVRGLRSGQLRIEDKKLASAPMVNTTPIPTQIDLTRESLSYKSAEGVLSSSEESGTISSAPLVLPATSNLVDLRESSKYLSALTSLFNTITPTGIVIHHTAVIPTQSTPLASERDVDQYHRTRGFEILCQSRVYHVAYHYLILADGRVQAGRPESCEGAHAEGYNSYLGISVVGDFSTPDNPTGNRGLLRPTEQQMASLVQLCRRLRARYHIPLQHVIRHSDISRTKCPGDRFPFAFFLHKLEEQPTSLKAEQQ
jgi:N-acetylmuramoyl-L-alanine amidase